MSGDEQLLRDLHAAQLITFGTTAPFALGSFGVKRVGYAGTPVCFCTVACKAEDASALIPIARQHVYRSVEAAGVPSDVLEFDPRVACQQSRHTFEDVNPSSSSCGRRKVGSLQEVRFDIRPAGLRYFAFEWHGGGRVREGVG